MPNTGTGTTAGSSTPRKQIKSKATKWIDPAKLRRNPVYFAERLLGLKLHTFQKKVLRDKADTVVHVAGRGAGKTIEAAALIAWFIYTKPRSLVVYISARERQGKVAHDTLMGMLAGTELYPDVSDDSTQRVKLNTGSTVHFLPGGNPIAARGLHNSLTNQGEKPSEVLLVLDESANIPRETYSASMGILTTAKKGRRKKLIIGSPLGTNHWLHDEWLAGNDPQQTHTSAHHTNAEDVPHVSQEYLAEMRAKLTPIEYGAEIRAEFQEALNSFFATYTDAAIREYAIPREALPRQSGLEYSLGVDLSQSARPGSDFTTLVVVERWWGGNLKQWDHKRKRLRSAHVEPYIRIAEMRRFQYLSFEGIRRELADIVERFPDVKQLTAEPYESTALQGIVGHGRDQVPLKLNIVTASNPCQRESFSYFHQCLRNGLLELPSEGEHVKALLGEMKSFQVKVTEHGNVTYSHPDGGHDDLVYGLNWALWGLKQRKPGLARAGYRNP